MAIYSDADQDAPHTKAADEAYRIGASLPPKSYLNIDAVMTAVKKSGADAVHPGYGFLAENASFAKAITPQGAVWLGPPAYVMAKIESKWYCRQIAQGEGVPCIPGTDAPIRSISELRQCFSEFGTSLLLKHPLKPMPPTFEAIICHLLIAEIRRALHLDHLAWPRSFRNIGSVETGKDIRAISGQVHYRCCLL